MGRRVRKSSPRRSKIEGQGQEQKSGKERAKEIMVKMKLGDEGGVERQLRIKSKRWAWPKKRGEEEGRRAEWTRPREWASGEGQSRQAGNEGGHGTPQTNQPTNLSPSFCAPDPDAITHTMTTGNIWSPGF
ncbi:hypothetical protein Pcinc_032900 [Petrolisthes cinctipes]|uniref:Uncharacterized protein n=1 Tax=Petrolisthes cinctipes TaxID=88211 RepID=A0AAE1K2N9_PETCI|nr:hypothetical protein Pcinc_032900 [Petrolisthes cinctipes]